MNRQIIVSATLFVLIATTVMITSPPILAKKSKGGVGTGNGDFDSGYRAGVAKAAKDVGKFNANQINGVDGNNPPPCPLPDNKPYCDGWKKGYSDKVVDDLD
jgi:hypothetical protein